MPFQKGKSSTVFKTVICLFALDELVLLTEVKIVESSHLSYHEVISVVITNCCRDGHT